MRRLFIATDALRNAPDYDRYWEVGFDILQYFEDQGFDPPSGSNFAGPSSIKSWFEYRSRWGEIRFDVTEEPLTFVVSADGEPEHTKSHQGALEKIYRSHGFTLSP